jgi:membrane protein implicated in regulation of membrane protease activity
MLTFRRRIYTRLPRPVGDVKPSLAVGDRVFLESQLDPGGRGRVEYEGSTLTARNDGDESIQGGAEAEITAVDGLTLHLRKPRSH